MQQLSWYGIDLFESCYAEGIITGVEFPKGLIKDLIGTDVIGNKAYDAFAKKRQKFFLIKSRTLESLKKIK